MSAKPQINGYGRIYAKRQAKDDGNSTTPAKKNPTNNKTAHLPGLQNKSLETTKKPGSDKSENKAERKNQGNTGPAKQGNYTTP